MKRLTIIKDDNSVGIDGKFYTIDCSSLPANFHALQWYDNVGEIEWLGNPKPRNTPVNSLTEYQKFIDEWNAREAFLKNAVKTETAIAAAARAANTLVY